MLLEERTEVLIIDLGPWACLRWICCEVADMHLTCEKASNNRNVDMKLNMLTD